MKEIENKMEARGWPLLLEGGRPCVRGPFVSLKTLRF